MKTITTLAAHAALAVLMAAAPAAAAPDAEQLFKFYCAQCHGLTGKGDGPNVTKDFPVSPRNFTDKAAMNKLSDADIKNAVRDGGPAVSKSPMMPPWGKTLSDAEIDALAKYLRTLCGCEGKQG